MVLQFAVVLCPPEVTVTVATFVPAVVYVLDRVLELPENESVPVHEYE